MALIDRDDLVNYTKDETVLLLYANHDEQAIVDAIAVSSADAIGALRKSRQYSVTAIEALTPATAPVELKDRVCARAIHRLTRADAGRPQSISDAHEEARTWFSWVASRAVTVEGLEISRRSRIRGSAEPVSYFRDDDECE